MGSASIASGVTTTGATTGVAVDPSATYTLQVSWSAGDATVLPQFSLDGVSYFDVAPALASISNVSNVLAYKISGLPVGYMRLYVSAISGGATVAATAAWV